MLPKTSGVGLKPSFYHDVANLAPKSMFFEVHPENYMSDGGPRLFWLEQIRKDHELSFHGVGASLGSLGGLCENHLKSLKRIVDIFEPAQVSEHATFSAYKNIYYPDLLPLPRVKAAHDNIANNIEKFQNYLQRQILIENPSNYIDLYSEMDEPDFLVSIAKKAGCRLLLDVNNIYVSSINTGIDPKKYIDKIPENLVGEIHIAGHEEDINVGKSLLIDSHGADVCEEVWDLLQYAINRFGPTPILLERDKNIPSFKEMLSETSKADEILINAKNEVHNKEVHNKNHIKNIQYV